MKNVLVFKSASDEVMQQLFEELAQSGDRVCCLIQPGLVQRYCGLYPDIRFIDSRMEVFEYEAMDFGLLKDMHIDDIYVPSSSPYFRNYENEFFIIDQMKYSQMVLYDCYGNKRFYQYKSRLQKKIRYAVSRCLFGVFAGAYHLKYFLRGSE